MEYENNLHTVIGFQISVSAKVANMDKPIDLIQRTPKRDKGPQIIPSKIPCRSGGNPNQFNVLGKSQNVVTFERLQFRIATANNGKRRAAQQYYVIIVELFAQTSNGQQIKVATSESAQIIVRGRSPGHYTDSPNDRSSSGLSSLDMRYLRRASSTDMITPTIISPMSPYIHSAMPTFSTSNHSQLISPKSPNKIPLLPLGYSNINSPHPSMGNHQIPTPESQYGNDLRLSYHNNKSGSPQSSPLNFESSLNENWTRARAPSMADSDCSFVSDHSFSSSSSFQDLQTLHHTFSHQKIPSPLPSHQNDSGRKKKEKKKSY